MSSNLRLSRAYKNAKVVPFDDSSKFVLFSDCHRGDNSFVSPILLFCDAQLINKPEAIIATTTIIFFFIIFSIVSPLSYFHRFLRPLRLRLEECFALGWRQNCCWWFEVWGKKLYDNIINSYESFWNVRPLVPRSEFIRPFNFLSICTQRFLTFWASSSLNSFLLRKTSFSVTTSNKDPWAICRNWMNSFLYCLPLPSAMFCGGDVAADSIWLIRRICRFWGRSSSIPRTASAKSTDICQTSNFSKGNT